MKVVLASAHRYPDLARLWFRFVARDLAPALKSAGSDVEILLFRDTAARGFEPRFFPGTVLVSPSFEALDAVAFYEMALKRPGDILFILDPGAFVLDGDWAASLLNHFEDPTVAAVSLARRAEQPGVFALLARREFYRMLNAPVLAPSFEALERWPHAVYRRPGERAAMALRARGKSIVEVSPEAAAPHLVDFSGTETARTAREILAGLLGPRFDALFVEGPLLATSAYDNLLLGSLFLSIFGAPFAAAPGGVHLSGSATPEDLRAAFATLRDRTAVARLVTHFDESDRAFARLLSREGLTRGALHVPRVLPRARALGSFVRRFVGKG